MTTLPDCPHCQELQSQVDMFRLISDNIYNGIMVTDAQGYVTHFNKPYGEFLSLDPEAQIGRHCTDVVENTRMHIVAQTGKPEINHSQRIRGQNMVVQRIPIRKDGKVIAVFGQVMFKDIRDVGKLASRLSMLESQVKLYEQELMSLRAIRYTFESIMGVSEAITNLKADAQKAAASLAPVLITGESGTGKELFAQAIHHASPRRLQPFVRINCAAIPRDLLESELFGYERGAFTGAKTDGKPGKFELADGGTVFLDEIGDLPWEMQPKLLRVLEEKEFERVGGTRMIRSDFRLMAASNQNLERMVAEKRFRRDLFYRLNVFSLAIPPLRERRPDILAIGRRLLQRMAAEAAMAEVRLAPQAEAALLGYEWPGNVRELSNVLERALATLEGDSIDLEDLPFHLRHRSSAGQAPPSSLREHQSTSEKEALRRALRETGHNKARAARRLGIHRTLLYKKMKKYGLPLQPAAPAGGRESGAGGRFTG
jgi:transcriptional regulator with PAS, ATPase and Fis domain